jgi:anti-sigma B factor antagonist/stage II sporulation protein AA (anti-sigma F factor antagonist)
MGTAESTIDLREERKSGVLIVRIRGRLDALSSPIAERKVFESINKGEQKLLLDFAGVTYLSSTGMRMLLSTTKKMKSLPGRIAVCSLTTNVMDVLKMSGFDHVLELFKSEEDALRHF